MSFNFGATNQANTTGTTPASTQPSLFGSTPAPAPTGGLFGNTNTNTTTPAFGSQFSFGSSAAPGATTTPATASTGSTLFGNTATNANSSKPAFSFGNTTSGTSSTEPPKTNLFGAPTTTTTGGGLFGTTGTATTTGTTTSKPTFGFGAAPTATATNTATTTTGTEALKPGGLFGNTTIASDTTGKPTLFGAAPAATSASTDAAKPATGLFGAAAPVGSTSNTASATPKPLFGFGATPTATATAAPATDSNKPAGGGLFGPTPATSATTASTSNFGGLFPPKPAEPAKPSDTAKPTGEASKPTESAPKAPAIPSLFGGASSTSGATTATTAPTGSLFGPAPTAKDDGKKEAGKTDTPAPAATTPFGGSLFGPKPGTTATATATAGPAVGTTTTVATTSSTAPVQAIPPSALRGKSVEEIVSKWQEELETQTKEFKRMAQEVEVWDRSLIENGVQISNLYASVQAAEAVQQSIDGTLDNIEEQQKIVGTALDGYEHEMKKIYGSESLGVDVGPADGQREKNYALAASLADQLDSLARGLSTMIDSVNDVSGGASSAQPKDDPVAQISAILNAHLESLQWIDGAVREAEERVKEVEGARGSSASDGRGSLGVSVIGGVGSGLGGRSSTRRSGRYGL